MAGIGSTLREARERANLDIIDFEVRTKIRAKYLRAMEDEEWGLLPGYTFTKGFLRTYADMLGLDGRALVDEFKRQYRDPSELELAPTVSGRRGDRARGSRERQRPDARERPAERPSGPPRGGGRPPIAVAVVVLVVLIAAALYAVGVLAGKKGKTPPVHTVTTQTTSTHSTGRRHHPASKGHTLPKLVGVRLEPTQPVYVCLIGYPGSTSTHEHIRIAGRTIVPGMHEPVYHDDHFHVTFGNNALAMYIDGHRYTFPASATAISFDILRNGSVHTLPKNDLPNCGT